MKKIMATLVGSLAVLAAIFGAGAANADNEYAGMTYEKAVQQMGGQTPVIASRIGDYLSTEQCLVTRSRQGNFLDSSGNNRGQVLLYLNCNDASALNGHSGNSVATEAGKQVQQAKKSAVAISEDYAKAVAAGETPACFKADGNTRWCVKMCTQSKSCSAELNEALGL